jgi:hypothetical protein
MDEERLRKMAIEQHLQDKSPQAIYHEMGRSKYWFFKWLHRYQSGDSEWYKDQPKTPHHHPHQTPLEMQNLIKNVRIQLEDSYAQVGTSSIKWEFKKLGITPPSDRTINRILKREGLVKKNSLYPQRSTIPLFQNSLEPQQHPSGRSPWPPIHQKRWPFLFAQHYGSLQPSSLYSSPTQKRRPSRCIRPHSLLENHRNPRLSSSRQRTLFSWKQSLPSLLWHCPQALSVAGSRGGLHPDPRTLAQWRRGEL